MEGEVKKALGFTTALSPTLGSPAMFATSSTKRTEKRHRGGRQIYSTQVPESSSRSLYQILDI
jgi:hypothetical protein